LTVEHLVVESQKWATSECEQMSQMWNWNFLVLSSWTAQLWTSVFAIWGTLEMGTVNVKIEHTRKSCIF